MNLAPTGPNGMPIRGFPLWDGRRVELRALAELGREVLRREPLGEVMGAVP